MRHKNFKNYSKKLSKTKLPFFIENRCWKIVIFVVKFKPYVFSKRSI